MPYNVIGPKQAVAALAEHIAAQRSKDPSYPWTIVVTADGPILEDDADVVDGDDEMLIEASTCHPELTIGTVRAEFKRRLIALVDVKFSKGKKTCSQIGAYVRDEEAQRDVQQRIMSLPGVRSWVTRAASTCFRARRGTY